MTSVTPWIAICFSVGLLYAGPVSCERLASLALPETAITLAQPVAAGALTLPADVLRRGDTDPLKELPPFCRVTATLQPTRDSDIKIEVWMPVSGWNGRFMAVGKMAAGRERIHYEGLSEELRAGFATAGTDTGHQGGGSDARFCCGTPRKADRFRLSLGA